MEIGHKHKVHVDHDRGQRLVLAYIVKILIQSYVSILANRLPVMATSQTFGAKSGATEIAQVFADQIKGKTVLITGVGLGNIGYATADALACVDVGLVIISGRSSSKLEMAAKQLLNDHPQVNLRILVMDLSSQKSVRKAAEEVNQYAESIDVIVNNAAVLALPERTMTEDGLEMHLACNHVSPFLVCLRRPSLLQN
jgi:lactate dehydrogenase-like 2-hydroxyacid dehydrogenase